MTTSPSSASKQHSPPSPKLLAILGPGLVVAATGVGAGDLATGAFTGSKLGVAILWAVVVGALLKFVVNEGVARWQLATETTLLEGVARHIGRWAIGLFLLFLLLWTYFVASALMSACGVAMQAIWPLEDPQRGKIAYGILHSVLAVVLAQLGGYDWFEQIMKICVALMFVVVIGTAVATAPDWGSVAQGLVIPRIPDAGGEGLSWTIALMGGIGGTVTVLSYGYWIREDGRRGLSELRNCRIDLATGYTVTALFGMGMVIIGSQFVEIDADPSKGTSFILELGKSIEAKLGQVGWGARWAFVWGAWAAVFSSMLGVWQSVPSIFADCWQLLTRHSVDDSLSSAIDPHSPPYLAYQVSLATVPAIGLWFSFVEIQKIYAIVGAMFVPLLAGAILWLQSRSDVSRQARGSWLITTVLAAAVALFLIAGGLEATAVLWPSD
jgi:Mn2+/Fe2+ NRAMP family transporter